MNLCFSIVSYLLGQDPKVLVSSGPDRSRSAGGLSECELRQEFGIWGAVRKKKTPSWKIILISLKVLLCVRFIVFLAATPKPAFPKDASEPQAVKLPIPHLSNRSESPCHKNKYFR